MDFISRNPNSKFQEESSENLIISAINLREEGTGEAYFFIFQKKIFFIQIYTNMYKN